MPKKAKGSRKKPTVEVGYTVKEMGRRFARMSREPLVKQDQSDAWNERQRRLSSARDSVHMLMGGTKMVNKAKAAKKRAAKKRPRGPESSK